MEENIDEDQKITLMGDINSEYDKLVIWMQELGLCELIEKNGKGQQTYSR